MNECPVLGLVDERIVVLRRWPTEVDWVEPLFRKYAEAMARAELPFYRSPDSVDWAVAYMTPMAWFESRGKWNAVATRYKDPWAQACGVFQHMPRYWSALSRMRLGGPRSNAPGRVESTIRLLRRAGVSEEWMDDPDTLLPRPVSADPGPEGAVYAPIGILHPWANVAVAARTFGFVGPSAWSPSRTVWKPELFEIGGWGWAEGQWLRKWDGWKEE